jgi:hypothetical protein
VPTHFKLIIVPTSEFSASEEGVFRSGVKPITDELFRFGVTLPVLWQSWMGINLRLSLVISRTPPMPDFPILDLSP